MDVYYGSYAPGGGRPSAPQKRFHRSRSRYSYFRAGAGSGKSHAGAREFMQRIFEAYQSRTTDGMKGSGLLYLCGAPTNALCEAGPWQNITKWLDAFYVRNGVRLDTKRVMNPQKRIQLVTGDEIMFFTLKNEAQFAGWTAAGFWIDEIELCDNPVGLFTAMNNRIRDERAVGSYVDSVNWGIVTSTPSGGGAMAYHFDAKIEEAKQQKRASMYSVFTSCTYDNPGASDEYIRGMLSTMSKREVSVMIYGNVEPPEGTIFGDEFSDILSICHDWKPVKARGGRGYAPKVGMKYFICIDWPPSAHALLVEYDPKWRPQGARQPVGRYTVFDEIIEDSPQIEQFCRAIAERCATKWGILRDDVDFVYCDAMPKSGHRTAGKPEFWPVSDGDPRVVYRSMNADRKRSGIETVRWCLKDNYAVRRLVFAARLLATKERRGVIECMKKYARINTVRDGIVVQTDRVRQDSPWSHAPDGIRYMIWPRESWKRRFHDAAADNR